MKPIHIVDTAQLESLFKGDGYEDATKARQALKGMALGNYSIIRVTEYGIAIDPPPETVGNVIQKGKTFITRAPKPVVPDEADEGE